MQAVCVSERVFAPGLRRLAVRDTIIAIDLGRYKSVACVYHHKPNVPKQRSTRDAVLVIGEKAVPREAHSCN